MSAADAAFLDAFDSGAPEGGVFGHREHLRLAWILMALAIIALYGLGLAHDLTQPRVRAFYAIDQRGYMRPEDIDLATSSGGETIVGREMPANWDIQNWDAK